ncbi:MAG TPA: V-type ATPase subunit, partial [Planctomycetota bacterium]|nr:V-type ATPase subunit [Planctomycetota bacterium]
LDLLRQPDLATALARLKQVETYVSVPDASSPGEVTRALEREYVRIACDLAKQSPDTTVCKLMLANYIFAEVRARVREALMPRHAGEAPGFITDDELDALAGGSVDGRLDLDALADAVRTHVERTGQPPEAMDLLIDREELVYMFELARGIGSEMIDTWIVEEGLMKAAVTIVRAQLAGESADRLIDVFLAPPFDYDWLIRLVREDFDRMDNVLMERLEAAEGELVTVARRTLGEIARRTDDKLTHGLRHARYVAYGPERLLGYLWALRTENLNLRLIAETFIVQADRDETRTKLRRSYVG